MKLPSLVLILYFTSLSLAHSVLERRDWLHWGTSSFGEGSALSSYWNPATLARIKQGEFATRACRLYSLEGLDSATSAIAFPLLRGGMGLTAGRFGSSVYREEVLYLSHGFEIGERLLWGYNLKGFFLKIEGFGSAATFSSDMGILTTVSKRVSLAACVINLNHPRIGRSREPIPLGYSFAAIVKPSRFGFLSGEIGKTYPNSVSLKTTLELTLPGSLVMRGGIHHHPVRFFCGFGARVGWVNLDYAYIHHETLSASHQFSVRFRWKKRAPRKSETSDGSKVRTKINLAEASISELKKIRGIGLATAKGIVSWREKHGIKAFTDLLLIPGMKRNVFFLLKEHCTIKSENPSP